MNLVTIQNENLGEMPKSSNKNSQQDVALQVKVSDIQMSIAS